MSDKQTPENAVDYKATLNLPGTEFAMKANLAVREAKWLEEWYADNIYQQIRASRIGKKKYVLHDGRYLGSRGFWLYANLVPDELCAMSKNL